MYVRLLDTQTTVSLPRKIAMIVVEMTDVFLYLFVIGASPHTHTPTTANYRLAANKTSALENKREGEGGGGF